MSQGYFDVIERELGRRCRDGAHRHRLRWFSVRGVGRAGTALAYAVPVLVAAGIAAVALSLHHGAAGGSAGAPTPTTSLPVAMRDLARLPKPEQTQIANIFQHIRQIRAASPACASARGRHANSLPGPTPSDLLARLSILRRPAVASDHLALGWIGSGGDGVILRDGIRLARTSGKTRIYVIPAIADPGVTAACVDAQRAGAAHAEAQLPPSVRWIAVLLANRFVISQSQHDGLELAGVAPHSGWGFGPVGLHELMAGEALAYNPQMAGVVPDGVARVEVFPRANGRDIGVNVLPVNNVFLFPGLRDAKPGFTRIVWYDASGRIVRTITPGTDGFGGGSSFGWAESSSSARVGPSPIRRSGKARRLRHHRTRG